MIISGKKYLITGGTGVIGYSLCKKILDMGGGVVVLSRDKNKLTKLKEKYKKIKIVVGDICDKKLVKKTIKKVDGVFHLAALAKGMQSGKSVESIQTNLLGSINILEESSDVDFVLGVSSDKAVQVSGTYGATKFLMEKLFNEFEQINKETKYRVVRLGNVIYSTDSVLCKWKDLIERGEQVIMTKHNATRFLITSNQSVDMILNCLKSAKDATPYFERMKSASVADLLDAIKRKYLPDGCELKIKRIGLQEGENLHEKISNKSPSSEKVEKYSPFELDRLL
jgi:UDP-N-acetylglucosamine 4,6-dehydratase/UDP-glucose 4-epimerase